jgi:DHA1 family multidrug resistance protein-like MFS transporter
MFLSDEKRGFLGLALLGLLESTAFFVISPILPQYVERYGASYIEIGYFFTVYSFTWTLLQLYTGYLSDKYGKRRFVFFGLLIYAVFAFLLGFAQTFIQLIIFRVLQGVGLGLAGPAALGLAAQFEEKGKSLAFYRTASSVGIIAGPLLGGFVATFNLSYPFFLCGIFSFAAMGSLRYLREEKISERAGFLKSLKGMVFKRNILLVCLAAFLIELCFASLEIIIPIVGSSLGFSSFVIGVVLSSYFLTFTLSQVPIGWLSERVEKRKLLIAASFGGLFPFLILYLSTTVSEMLLAMGLLGVALGAVFVQASALVAEISPKGREGMYMAFFDAIIDFTFPVTPLIVTYLATIELKLPFLLLTGLMGSASLVFVFVKK